ncbi:MAG: iron chaperone [Bdellovibrionales bacterium]
MSSPRFNSVEEYLASVDPTKARTLKSIIDLILSQFPELEAKISWNVPTIHRKGKYVVGICAYKHHLTFSAWSPGVIEDFKVRLAKFVVFKNCFQIPVDWKIDSKLVKDLVRARLAELDLDGRPA